MKEQIPKFIVDQCRENRKNATEEENYAWKKLRNRNFKDLKFIRQHPIIHFWNERDVHYFIADFFCHKLKLVLEIDGGYHLKTKEYDEMRDEIIKNLGLFCLRIKNEEIWRLESILTEFVNSLNKKE